MIIIYFDVYFFINFCLDYISLYISGMAFHKNASAFRLIVASLVGALVSLGLIFSPSPILSVVFLVLCAYLMCLISFSYKCIPELLTFIASSVFLGGILTSLQISFTSAKIVLISLLVAFGGGFYFYSVQKRVRKNISIISVITTVTFGKKTTQLHLLVDSGNFATEGLTGKRIIFVGYEAVKKLEIPEGTKSYPLSIKSATGKSVVLAYEPDSIITKEYGGESFLIAPNENCKNFAGFDGIIPVAR